MLQLELGQVGAVMAMSKTQRLGVLLAVALVAWTSTAAGQAPTPSPMPQAAPTPGAGDPFLPGLNRADIRPDSLEQRAELLRRLESAPERQTVTRVAPLPAQTINPGAARR
jgi:hypothetical protein